MDPQAKVPVSDKMKALARFCTERGTEIEPQRRFAFQVLKMTPEEFDSRPWNYEHRARAYRRENGLEDEDGRPVRNKTEKGGTLVFGSVDREEQARRIYEVRRRFYGTDWW